MKIDDKFIMRFRVGFIYFSICFIFMENTETSDVMFMF